jgi:hypothetical protein
MILNYDNFEKKRTTYEQRKENIIKIAQQYKLTKINKAIIELTELIKLNNDLYTYFCDETNLKYYRVMNIGPIMPYFEELIF